MKIPAGGHMIEEFDCRDLDNAVAFLWRKAGGLGIENDLPGHSTPHSCLIS